MKVIISYILSSLKLSLLSIFLFMINVYSMDSGFNSVFKGKNPLNSSFEGHFSEDIKHINKIALQKISILQHRLNAHLEYAKNKFDNTVANKGDHWSFEHELNNEIYIILEEIREQCFKDIEQKYPQVKKHKKENGAKSLFTKVLILYIEELTNDLVNVSEIIDMAHTKHLKAKFINKSTLEGKITSDFSQALFNLRNNYFLNGERNRCFSVVRIIINRILSYTEDLDKLGYSERSRKYRGKEVQDQVQNLFKEIERLLQSTNSNKKRADIFKVLLCQHLDENGYYNVFKDLEQFIQQNVTFIDKDKLPLVGKLKNRGNVALSWYQNTLLSLIFGIFQDGHFSNTNWHLLKGFIFEAKFHFDYFQNNKAWSDRQFSHPVKRIQNYDIYDRNLKTNISAYYELDMLFSNQVIELKNKKIGSLDFSNETNFDMVFNQAVIQINAIKSDKILTDKDFPLSDSTNYYLINKEDKELTESDKLWIESWFLAKTSGYGKTVKVNLLYGVKGPQEVLGGKFGTSLQFVL